jgi:hypothetical protein
MSEKKEEVVTRCAILYNEDREKASKAKSYVPAGMLKKNTRGGRKGRAR